MYISGFGKNPKILKVFIIILLILIITFINSCNLFFSTPHGRENIYDPAAQITAFTALPSSDNSVVTMWNWKEPPSWVYDDRITDIQIQHSIFGYPDNYIFFASESITDKNMWQKEWTDLIPGITHYFSLFARIDDGDNSEIWLAPIKAKVKLPGTYFQAQPYSVQTYEVDDTGIITPGGLASTVSSSFVFVLELGIPEGVFIESAYIDIGKITTTGVGVRVYPVTREWNKFGPDYHSWEQLWLFDQGDYAVDDNVNMLIDTVGVANPSPIDITEIVRKTAIVGPIEIIFKEENFTPETVTINDVNDFLVINYYKE